MGKNKIEMRLTFTFFCKQLLNLNRQQNKMHDLHVIWIPRLSEGLLSLKTFQNYRRYFTHRPIKQPNFTPTWVFK